VNAIDSMVIAYRLLLYLKKKVFALLGKKNWH